jgi:predicted DNA-binding protein (MmcQ/YjbR family)
MTIDRFHTYLLGRPGAVEDRPFGPDVPVYKVMGKMFAYLLPRRSPPWLTLKLDPVLGQLARSTHPAVSPGYHMNKEHWNTIVLDGSVADAEIMAWIDESYDLVVSGLTRAKRNRLHAGCKGGDG